eukprot:4154273-Ditylum_brightwellii.AAC.1
MGVNCQATAWQLTPISDGHCVRDLDGFCCVLLYQNRPSNIQHALSFFHENDKNNGGSDNKKTSCLLPQPTPLRRLVPFEAIALDLKGRNLGCQWQPMTHPFAMPSLLPHLPYHLLI